MFFVIYSRFLIVFLKLDSELMRSSFSWMVSKVFSWLYCITFTRVFVMVRAGMRDWFRLLFLWFIWVLGFW